MLNAQSLLKNQKLTFNPACAACAAEEAEAAEQPPAAAAAVEEAEASEEPSVAAAAAAAEALAREAAPCDFAQLLSMLRLKIKFAAAFRHCGLAAARRSRHARRPWKAHFSNAFADTVDTVRRRRRGQWGGAGGAFCEGV
jgi:hypothetical protein